MTPTCCVGPCGRAAVVKVAFETGGTLAYCEYHGYRYGKLRWDDNAVHHHERIKP